MNRDEIQAVAQGRAFVYELLHRLLGAEPSHELLSVLCSESTRDALGLFAPEAGSSFEKALDELAGFASSYHSGEEAVLSNAKSEYMRLFVGPASLIAPPWESVYTSADHLMFQMSTLDVKRTYQRYGVVAAEDGSNNVASDHIALELAFMGLLAGKEFAAREAGNLQSLSELLEEQARFLDGHLLNWVGAFVSKMMGGLEDDAVLYPTLAKLTASFLAIDRALIEELRAE